MSEGGYERKRGREMIEKKEEKEGETRGRGRKGGRERGKEGCSGGDGN